MWWLLVAAVGAFVLAKTEVGQLDLRGRRQQGSRPRDRCAGRPGQDRPLRHGVAVRLPGRNADRPALRHRAGQPGHGLEFEYIIAAVVGGCLLTGGYGSVIGAALGAAIMAVSANGVQTHEVELRRSLRLPRRRAAARSSGQQLHPQEGAGGTMTHPPTTSGGRRSRRARAAGAAPHLQVLRQRHRAREHHHQGRGRQGHLRARRQRRRQVDVHQDPVGRAPAELRRVHDVRHAGRTSRRRAMRATPGIAAVFQDLALAPLMSIWRNFFLGVEPMRARQSSCAARS